MKKFVNFDKEKLLEHVSVGMPDHNDPFFKHLDKIALKPKENQNLGILKCAQLKPYQKKYKLGDYKDHIDGESSVSSETER